MGTISANPLYVSAPSNLRLTSNSPSRFAGDTGQDLGPLPYVSDATPGLYGTLWVNTTLTKAGSPYAVPGDLTVPTGVTLTIDPGVTVSFASGSDIMGSGADTGRPELSIAGRLVANGGSSAANQIKLTTSGGVTANAWYGVVLLGSATQTSIIW